MRAFSVSAAGLSRDSTSDASYNNLSRRRVHTTNIAAENKMAWTEQVPDETSRRTQRWKQAFVGNTVESRSDDAC